MSKIKSILYRNILDCPGLYQNCPGLRFPSPLIISETEEDNTSTLSTLKRDISERSTPSTLPDIPDPDADDLPEDTISSNKNFYQGLKELKPWTYLPDILKKDNKMIL